MCSLTSTLGALVLATRIGRFNQRRAFSLLIAGASVVIALLFIASIGSSISGPIAELREVADRINKGDLSTSADMDRGDENGQLAGAINRLRKTLQSGGNMKAADSEPSRRFCGQGRRVLFRILRRTGLDCHGSHAGRVPLPQKFRLILLLTHPASQDKQRIAQTIEKPHESRIQRLFFPQPHTDTFRSSADRSSLV